MSAVGLLEKQRAYAQKHQSELDKLMAMGFEEDSCVAALYRTKADVNLATAWLLNKAGGAPREAPAPSADGFKPKASHGVGPMQSKTLPSPSSKSRRQIDLQTAAGWVIASIKKEGQDDKGNKTILVEYASGGGPVQKGWVRADSSRIAPLGKHTGQKADSIGQRAGTLKAGAASSSSTPAPQATVSATVEPAREKSVPTAQRLEKEMFVDCRDTVGKWLEAQIKSVDRGSKSVVVHFLRWADKWDERINYEKNPDRFADFHSFSAGEPDPRVRVGTPVTVKTNYVHSGGMWVPGFVRKIDKLQVQVQFEISGKKFQYWYHLEAPGISVDGLEPGVGALEEDVADSGSVVKAKKESAGDSAAHSSGGGSGGADEYFKGQFIEVKDTVGKWLPAEVLQVAKDRIFIHYEGWSARWDEWLSSVRDKARIRKVGDGLEETVEEKERKQEEERFRTQLMEKRGFKIVDCEKDGNCLFRSVAHQIYNDPSRHMEVRQACYDYMERDREFFSVFVAGDFDEYVEKRRKKNEWGDHVEIVVLREMYNKNVEVYDKDSVSAPKPLVAKETDLLPIMRLSYHGQSHYNSVVDPAKPPPLGDGSKSKVKLRELRLKEQDEEKKLANQPKADSSASLGRTSSKQTLMRKTSDTPTRLLDSDFDQIWGEIAGEDEDIEARNVTRLVESLLRAMYKKKRAALEALNTEAARQDIESLAKAYDDTQMDVEAFASRLLVNCLGDKKQHDTLALLKREDTEAYFFQSIMPDMEWALSKG